MDEPAIFVPSDAKKMRLLSGRKELFVNRDALDKRPGGQETQRQY